MQDQLKRDPFILESSGLPSDVRVLAFDGTEEISATYRYEIDLLVDPDADLGHATGATATLTVQSDAAEGSVVHGVIGGMSVIENMAEYDVYRVLLVPRVRDALGHDRHSRVFVGETVPSILQTLLREAGFDVAECEFRLSRDYEPIDFVCQYRESTLDFLARWMERDGIYYHFEHDGTRERLIITDDRGKHPPAKVSAAYQTSVGLREADGLRRFRVEHHTVPGRVQVDDYDYLRPALPVMGQAVVEGGNQGELRVRGAKVTTPKEANRIAKLRAEGLYSRRRIFRGEGRLQGLHAGQHFALLGHPRQSLDGDYLVTKLRIRGHATGDLGSFKAILGRENEPDEGLRVDLEAIPGDVQFRPELKTSTPRVHGVEGGVIDGDADSDYAQLDQHGRYLVKFRFDERAGHGSQASARIRMMQPHAGSPEGMHLPLRKGTEVVLSFLGGDPDRPLIAGAVPNPLSPAVVHSGNATKNVIQTGGMNQITMEDQQGKQYVQLKTPSSNTYMHLGATIVPHLGGAGLPMVAPNPVLYNVVKNTDGTSLTYTTQLSTSYTGDDTETLVERARVTVIGRGVMTSGDQTAASEVSSLLGPTFMEYLEQDIGADLLVWINTFVAATAKDAGTANTDAGTATTLSNWQTIMIVLQGPTDTYLQATCVQYDLAGNPSGAAIPTTYPQAPNGLLDALNQWLQLNPGDPNAQQVLTDAQKVQTDLGTAVTAVQAIITAGATTPSTTLATAAVAAVKALKSAVGTMESDADKVQQASTSAMPGSPSPTIDPQYINIRRGLGGVDPLPDPTLPAVTIPTDATAFDILNQSAYPGFTLPTTAPVAVPYPPSPSPSNWPYLLAPGSDVKIVGGDNMTLTANDARSHTRGHAYALVQAGQTSVVYSSDKYAGAIQWTYGNAPTQLAQDNAAVTTAQAALQQANAAVASLQTLGPVPPVYPEGPEHGDPAYSMTQYLSSLRQVVSAAGTAATYPVTQAGASQAQAALTNLGAAPSPPPTTYVNGRYVPPTIEQTEDYWNALHSYLSSALSAVQTAFDNAVKAAQANLNQATTVLEALLVSLPIRPPATLPRSWIPTSVAQNSSVYGNVLSWLEGMKRTTVTHGIHSIVYSPLKAPQATPAQTNPSVPLVGTGSGGSPFTTFSLPNVDPGNLPVSNVAQSSEIYGDRYSYLAGTQYAAITNDKTTVVAGHVSSTIRSGQDTTVYGNTSSTVNGHAHSFISGGQDSTIHSGQTVHVTGGKTSTVVGVNFSGTAPLNVSADVLKLAMAAVTMSVSILKIDLGVMVLKNHPTNIAVHGIHIKLSDLVSFV
ncbi:MAG: type VI secretion system tip protein TssI/VgrG [Polyangiaceae bacterium]|jgi:type VI secretion system secreted protein VgrG